MMSSKKIAIIGSGPAGLTAAIYCSRAFLDTTVYSGLQPGGQLTITTLVENYPGFPEGIQGPELMENMMKQAQRFGSRIIPTGVQSLTIHENQFCITLDNSTSEYYDGIIIASGASPRYLGIEGEEQYLGKGYHSCATCDGFFYKNKDIIVVGGGDSAMEEAIFLTKFANSVTIVHRRADFRASAIMLHKAQNNPKIRWKTQSIITRLIGDTFLNSVEITDTITQKSSTYPIDAVFVAIGHSPNTQFASFLSRDELGYLRPVHKTMSEVEGIFIAGDVCDKEYRQAITAAGEGCKAAMDLEKWLETKK